MWGVRGGEGAIGPFERRVREFTVMDTGAVIVCLRHRRYPEQCF